MLVVELEGRIQVLPAPYTTPDPTPFLQLTNIGSAGVQQGIYDIVLDPSFSTNRFYYIFYTLGTPNRDRVSRFTANSTLTGTVAGSELVLYQDPQDANAEHHGGRPELRQRRQALLHHRRALRRGRRPVAQQLRAARSTASTRTGPSPTTTRSSTARAPTSTRSGRSACATRTGRPTTRRPVGSSSAMSAATTTPLPRKRSTSARRAPTTAGPTPRSMPVALREPDPLLPPQRSRRLHHRRVRLPREPVPQRVRRAATSSPTTPRTGSGGSPSTPTGTSAASSTSSRSTARSTARTATSSTSPRARTARSTTSTSATPTSAARSA